MLLGPIADAALVKGMKTMLLSESAEKFAVFAAKGAIRGDHLGPIPTDWREIPDWWRTEGRRIHVARQGGDSARQLEGPVRLLSAILAAKRVRSGG